MSTLVPAIRTLLDEAGVARPEATDHSEPEVVPALVLLERLVDARVKARLTELVDQLSIGIATQLFDRLQGVGSTRRGVGDRLLTVAEAANRLSVSRSTVYELIRRGDLASIRVGGSRRIEPEALAELKAILASPPPSPTPTAAKRTTQA